VELLLIRHALPARVVRDDGLAADPELTDLGHRQAAAMTAWVTQEPIDALYVSPLLRALQTAAPLAERLRLEALVVDAIAEYDRHDPVYIPLEEIKAARDHRWEQMLADNGTAERRAWRALVVDAMEQIVAANPSRRVAVVCHGGVINAYLSHVMGIDSPMFFEPGYASVHRVIAASTGQRSVSTLNEAPYLRGLAAG
jgi:probable phosphoglycerate mutase